MTTPNLGLALAAAPDTIAQALITKFNGNFSSLDTIIGNKVDKGSPITNLITTTAVAGGVPLVAKGILLQSGNLFEARDNVDVVKASIDPVGRLSIGADLSAILNISSSGTTAVPIRVQGFVGQTGNLQDWRNSSGTALADITSAGEIVSSNGAYLGPNAWASLNAGLGIIPRTAADKGIIIRAAPSQTGNILEAQSSSGTAITKISSIGIVQITGTGTQGTDNGAWLAVSPQAAGDKGIVVRGAASQTANLFEAQLSAGTLVGGFDNSGQLIFSTVTGSAATATIGASGAPPAQVAGYIIARDQTGTARKIPYYNN